MGKKRAKSNHSREPFLYSLKPPPSKHQPYSAGGQFRSVERAFLQLLDGATAASSGNSIRVMEGEVRCLAALLRLDHRVAGRCLPRLLALLATRYALASPPHADANGDGDGDEAAAALPALRQACLRTVSEAADTYARLRQAGTLLEALLALEEGQGATAGPAARALVADPEVAAALGRAIRDCPPPQFVPLWDTLAGAAAAGAGEEEEEGEEAAITRRLGEGGVRYRLLSLLLAHLRVSALNAAALGGRAAALMARVRLGCCVVLIR